MIYFRLSAYVRVVENATAYVSNPSLIVRRGPHQHPVRSTPCSNRGTPAFAVAPSQVLLTVSLASFCSVLPYLV